MTMPLRHAPSAAHPNRGIGSTRTPTAFRLLASCALFTLVALLSGCGGGDKDDQESLEDIAQQKPFDQWLGRAYSFPQTEQNNGPWTLAERANFYAVPGVAVVAWDGRRKVEQAWGVADEDKNPVTTTTVFSAGPRISTGVSSLVVMAQLSESSRNLNRSLDQELSTTSLRASLRDVTLAQLLSHSAGIGPVEIPESAASMESLLAESAFPMAQKGSDVRFSETGYAILQEFFETVTLRPWNSLSQQKLFEPLGVTANFGTPPKGLAMAPIFDQRGRVQPDRKHVADAATGLYISAADLAKLLRSVQDVLSRQQTVSPFTVRQLRFALEPELGNWGMGWEQVSKETSSGNSNRISVARDDSGRNLAVFFQDRPAGAVILTNGARGARLAREILVGIAQDFGWEGFESEPVFPFPPTRRVVEAVLGEWRTSDTEFTVDFRRDKLLVTGLTAETTEMLPIHRTQWILEDGPHSLSVDLQRDDQLRVDGVLALRTAKPRETPDVDDH